MTNTVLDKSSIMGYGYQAKLSFLSRNVRKRTFGHVRPAKIHINLRIRFV